MKTSLVGFSYVILKNSRTSESELQFEVHLLLSFISLEQSKKSFEKIGQQEARSWCSLSIITDQEKEDSVKIHGKKTLGWIRMLTNPRSKSRSDLGFSLESDFPRYFPRKYQIAR